MTQKLNIHPTHPQTRLIRQAAEMILQGKVVVYPTDSAYAIGCQIGNKEAIARIRQIRQLDKKHHFTLLCRDLSEIASYAVVDNPNFRILKAHTPGPYTFILKASSNVPKVMQHPKRKTVGLRVPDHPIIHEMLAELGQPLLSVTVMMPDDDLPLVDIDNIEQWLTRRVDLIIDGGFCGREPTSVIDLTEAIPEVLRAGKGDVSAFR